MLTVIHAIIGYFFLLLTVRVLTRRPGGQMTPFEFVIIFLIGGVIILATVDHDDSMTNCICAIVTVAFLHQSTSWLRSHSSRIGSVIDGAPMVLLDRGQWNLISLRHARIDPEDVMAAARTKGISSLSGVKYAILERNGTISIIRKDESKS